MRTVAPPNETSADRTGALIDLIEDALHLDQPVRPSVRRRVNLANDEAIRTLRHLATEDEGILAPDNVRAICNAIASRHAVKPRFMLTTRELGEQLSFEFAASGLSPTNRARLIASAVRLERRRAATDQARRPMSARRSDRTVERLAITQVVLAAIAIATAVVMLVDDRTRWGVGFKMAALSFIVMARAVLVLAADRRVHVLPDAAPAATGGPTVHRSIEVQIDLRDSDS
jgi:hypothetical protein